MSASISISSSPQEPKGSPPGKIATQTWSEWYRSSHEGKNFAAWVKDQPQIGLPVCIGCLRSGHAGGIDRDGSSKCPQKLSPATEQELPKALHPDQRTTGCLSCTFVSLSDDSERAALVWTVMIAINVRTDPRLPVKVVRGHLQTHALTWLRSLEGPVPGGMEELLSKLYARYQ